MTRHLLLGLLLLGLSAFGGAPAPIEPASPPAACSNTSGLLEISYCGRFSTPGGGGGGGGTIVYVQPKPCAFYLSTTGNDANNGISPTTAFRTFGKAQTVMQGALTQSKVTCVRAGNYGAVSLTLGSADAGETWQYYTVDGVNTAVLNGGDTTAIAFNISGATGVTINGLSIQHYNGNGSGAIALTSQTSNVTIANSDIGNMTVFPAGGASGQNVGIYAAIGCPGLLVSHNYLHDMQSDATAIGAFDPGESCDGAIVDSNVVLNTALGSNDAGAIGFGMRGTGLNGGHVTISNNFIRDWGSPSFGQLNQCIYLDDNSSNFTVTGNICGPPTSGVGVFPNDSNHVVGMVEVHDGNNNTIKNNIFDYGASFAMRAVYYGFDSGSLTGNQAGQLFTNNLFLGNFGGSQNPWCGVAFSEESFGCDTTGISASWYTIQNNTYWNFGGGAMISNGTVIGDSHPISLNPLCTGYLYTLASNSPVFTIPGGFTDVTPARNAGPPGFTIPTSTNKSCPG